MDLEQGLRIFNILAGGTQVGNTTQSAAHTVRSAGNVLGNVGQNPVGAAVHTKQAIDGAVRTYQGGRKLFPEDKPQETPVQPERDHSNHQQSRPYHVEEPRNVPAQNQGQPIQEAVSPQTPPPQQQRSMDIEELSRRQRPQQTQPAEPRPLPETRSEIAQPSLNAVATNAIPEFRPVAVPAADDVSVHEMQSYLKIGGFYNRDLDGIAGSGTQAGIEEFVQSRGLDLDAGNPEAVLAALQNDPALKQRMAGIVREGMAADPDQAAALQTILTAQGHDTQGIDGKVGNNTRMAYNEYATENDLSHAIYPIVATADTAKMGAINLHDRSVISPSYNTRSDHVAATGYNHEVAQGPTMRSNGMPINDPAIPQSPDVTLKNDMPATKPQILSI